MNFLSAEKLFKAYGDKVLFDEISLGIDQGQKAALIGVNGCGKTTLLKVLAGVDAADSGKISLNKSIRVAYLPQEPDLPADKSVREIVFSAELPALQAIKEYDALVNDPEADAEAMQAAMDRIDELNAWDYEVKIKQILGRLGVDFMETLSGELSGGQRKRVAMAQVLIEEPELLILDEPTNHLDLATIEWLEKYLSTSKQSLLLVTHDRYFLDSITDEIFELDFGKLYRYEGNYAYFLEKKAEREQRADEDILKARNLLRTELEWLRRSPKARGTKARYRVNAVKELQNKAENRQTTGEINIRYEGQRMGSQIIDIENLSKAFGDTIILDRFSYKFQKKERLGIVGPNGAGKSSFLKLLTGDLSPDSGTINRGSTIQFGHYRQEHPPFDPEKTLIATVQEIAEGISLGKGVYYSASQLLSHFLFSYAKQYHKVGSLSGGEKRRLHLLRVLMRNPNFLILDEPTNDLDLMTLRTLETFLADFGGCLIIVSHDRYFMDRLVDHLFIFEGAGKIRDFPGSYSQYRSEILAKESATITKADKTSSPKSKTPAKEKVKTKLTFNEQREYETLTTEIEELEAKKQELETNINSGETDFEKLTEWTKDLEELKTELEAKEDRWLELAEYV